MPVSRRVFAWVLERWLYLCAFQEFEDLLYYVGHVYTLHKRTLCSHNILGSPFALTSQLRVYLDLSTISATRPRSLGGLARTRKPALRLAPARGARCGAACVAAVLLT